MANRPNPRILVIFLAVSLMVIGVVAIHWYLGVREWANAKAEWVARGEPVKAACFNPSPLTAGHGYFSQHPLLQAQLHFSPDPDGPLGSVIYDDPEAQRVLGSLQVPEESSATTGSLAKLSRTDFAALAESYKLKGPETDALASLARHLSADDATFHSLIEAARLPAGNFGAIWVGDRRKVLVPHYAIWTNVARLSTIRARVALATGHSREAYEELSVVFRLAETLGADPVTMAGMVQTTLRIMTLHVIWEGLQSRSWRREELSALEDEVRTWRTVEEWIRAWQGDRYLQLQAPSRELSDAEWDNVELLTGKMPRWLFKIPGLDEFADANCFRAETEFCYLPLVTRDWRKVRDGKTLASRIPEYHIYSIYTKRMLPLDLLLTERCVIMECYHSQVQVAVALECYCIANGNYPDVLEELVPQYLPSVPVDVFDGASLRYARTRDGRFLLYSIGWNLRDDGGAKAVPVSYDKGDIVWKYDVDGAEG